MRTISTTFRFAVFHKADGPLSKSIQLDNRGRPRSNSDDCRMTDGVAQNYSANCLSEVASMISQLKSENALALGTIVGRSDDDPVQITTKNREKNDDDAIARTKENFEFAEGAPGLALVDFDQKGMPNEIREKIQRAGGPWEAICEAIPALASAGLLRRASTSAGLRNLDTGKALEGSGGEHIYVAVQDASDIPRATKVLHQRLWLSGLGWILLGKVGQKLERSIADQSVGSPERLVFEGPPVLVPPLGQCKRAREPVVHEGEVIDTRKVLPNLTPQEKARLEVLVRQQKNEREAEAKELRDRHDERLSEELSQTAGVPVEQARQQVAQRHSGKLLPLHPLLFDDAMLGEVSVKDVLLDPARFVEQTLADPLEGVSYGRNKAKVFQRADGSLWINSFAHGGGTYDLKHDGCSLRALVERVPESTSVEEFILALANSELEAGEEKGLLRSVKDATGINIGDLRDQLEIARRNIDAREHNFGELSNIDDGRILLPAPTSRAELTPTITRIDQVLCDVEVPVPPFRTLDHRLAKVSRRPMTKLHRLMADGDVSQTAPPQTTINIVDVSETTMLIEEHVRLLNGRGEVVRLPLPFVRAYASWEGSELPRVNGIATIPIVLPNRELKTGTGLDRELSLIFDIAPELQTALEDLNHVSLDEAIKAFEWLCNEWLVDVDTDNAGKAIIIAMALTIIERHLLPEKPAFFVTAAQRGSGKTTGLNMVATAITGSMASAASWSFDDEERRKGVFSYLREGAAMVVYDNVLRGSALSCSTIERALTTHELSDRVLGESRSETVSTSTVIAFTGNNISPKGDMASRSLVAQLETSRTDPENREFAHEHPIEWTVSHRPKILRCLYTLLMLDRVKPNRGKTRFKLWWHLVGHPLELVSGVDFEGLFRTNDQFDEEAQGATEFIAQMVKHLGLEGKRTREFNAAEVAKLADESGPNFVPRSGENRPDRETLRSALEDASGRPFSGGRVTSHRVARKLLSIEDRPVEIDGKIFCLRVVRDHEGNRYRIEESASN